MPGFKLTHVNKKFSFKTLSFAGSGHTHNTDPVKDTVKPVCNDHLNDKIYYLWFMQ